MKGKTMLRSTILAAAAMLAVLPLTAMSGGLADPIPEYTPEPPVDFSFAGLTVGLQFGHTEAEMTETRETTTVTETSTQSPVTEDCPTDYGHSGGAKCTFPDGIAEVEFPGIGACNGDYTNTCVIGVYEDGRDWVFIKGAEIGGTYTYDTGETVTVPGDPITTTAREYVETFVEEGDVGVFISYAVELGNDFIGRGKFGYSEDLMTGDVNLGYQMHRVMPYVLAGVADYRGNEGTHWGAGVDVLVTQHLVAGVDFRVGEYGDYEAETIGLNVGYKF